MTTLLAPTRSQTVTMTAAQAIIRFLSAQHSELIDGNVEPLFGGVWGIFGHGNVAGLGEALYSNRKRLAFFRGQNEQSMAHAAIAYAKAHRARRMMAVTSSIGPGATNMVTAAALAHANRLPVLLLPGDVYASRRPDPVLQQLEDPSCPAASVNDCFRPVSRLFDRVTRPEQLIDLLPHAVHVLLDPSSRGPVTLSLPQDVQAEAFDYPESLFSPKIHTLRRIRPDLSELRAAARVLVNAARPLVIAGGGVHYSGAEETLRLFAERYSIPVVETQAGKGSLPWDHPMNLGAIGVTGTSAANHIAAHADVILCIGTRLSDFTSASRSLIKGVQIGLNTTPSDAHKHRSQPVVADARAALEELTLPVTPRPEYLAEIAAARAAWYAQADGLLAPSTAVPTDAQALGAVNCAASSDAIVVCAAGGLPGELHKLWRSGDPIGYHVEYAYSCMGYEIAAGLGAKMAHPHREVIVMVGDGSYLMMHTELLTAVQMGLHIQVIVLDNHGFGCINRLQKGCGQPPFGNLFEGPQVDFVANARSYGCHAELVETPEQLSAAVARNRTRTVPAVTVIRTDPQRSTPGTAWWDVAIAQISDEPGVQHARLQYDNKLKDLLCHFD